jgi:Uncharacterized protein conserved in bacteria
MTEKPLKNQIIEWLRKQDYWFQNAGNKLLEVGEINQSLIDSTYELLKEDLKLKEVDGERPIIDFNEIPLLNIESSNNLILNSIRDIENVNALAQGQGINIDKNLTVVYGNNGSGKSGYIRLINNAFNSRGDKSLLGNVFSENQQGEPKCRFLFQTDSVQFEKLYPEDKGCIEFSQYSSFDAHSVKVHLDDNNQLNFVPRGFDFFDKVLKLFEELSSKLNKEIREKRQKNSFTIHFQNYNEIQERIQSLSSKTNIDELIKLSEYTDKEEKELENLNKRIVTLKSQNVQVQITGLEKLQRELQKFRERQQLILDNLTKEKTEYYLDLIDSHHKLLALSKEQGIKRFEKYEIESIGTQQWRDFIIAAKKYSESIQNRHSGSSAAIIQELAKKFPNAKFPFGENKSQSEQDIKHCIFCLQPLSHKENELIENYWIFLKSEAERELNRVIQNITAAEKDLKGLAPVKFDDSLNLYNYLNENDPLLVNKWKTIVEEAETSRNNLIENLSNKNRDLPINVPEAHTSDFEKIERSIKKEIETLILRKPDQEISKHAYQIQFLTDKSLLKKLLPQILKFIAEQKWADLAESQLNIFKTNSITSFQGTLFSQHITEKYKQIFNDECRKVNAPMIVDIIQQNSKAKTFRKLQVANQTASLILSEGEQRAISLADFITEVQLNQRNRGVIFDDPVTSLDHERRATIAKRLVDLSESKQVIIFTHDISFLSKLTFFASKNSAISLTTTTIRKVGNITGIVNPELPWVAQKISARIKYLRNLLVSIKKLEKEGNEDQYNLQIKGWYGMLREAWERCVEERLFKGSIERFSGEIHTKPLSKVEVNEELVSMIDEGMSQASNWVHDQAMGLNPPIPDINKAERDLEFLNSFSEKCAPF